MAAPMMRDYKVFTYRVKANLEVRQSNGFGECERTGEYETESWEYTVVAEHRKVADVAFQKRHYYGEHLEICQYKGLEIIEVTSIDINDFMLRFGE